MILLEIESPWKLLVSWDHKARGNTAKAEDQRTQLLPEILPKVD
jgi:hypothetical protein